MTPLQKRLDELRLGFIGRAANERRRIANAFARGDLQTVSNLSHRLHGIAGTFGFAELSAAAAAVEEAIEQRAADLESRVGALLDQLDAVA